MSRRLAVLVTAVSIVGGGYGYAQESGATPGRVEATYIPGGGAFVTAGGSVGAAATVGGSVTGVGVGGGSGGVGAGVPAASCLRYWAATKA